MKKYGEYILEKAAALLAIDSPTGYTKEAAKWVTDEFTALGFTVTQTVKGGVIVDFGGKDNDNGIVLEAHTDTLGAMISEIKSDGRLKVTRLGGMNANNAEAENVRVITKFDGVYEGTLQLVNASLHVNGEYDKTNRDWNTVEVVLDELVSTKEDVQKLGINTGDIVCFDPRTKITEKGFIKSRFLDDKLSVAILLGFGKYLKDKNVVPARHTYGYITVYEEVGHGGCASLPSGVTEAISVDMGCVGEGLTCTEQMVSICAKDSGGPYNYDVVTGLIEAADLMSQPMQKLLHSLGLILIDLAAKGIKCKFHNKSNFYGRFSLTR